MQKLFLAILLIFCFKVVKSHEWKYSGVFLEENHENIYYRKPTIKKEENGKQNIIKVWTKNHLAEHKDLNSGETYYDITQMNLWKFDCTNKQFQLLESVYYSSKGENIATDQFNDKWDDVIPESISEGLLNIFCKLYNK
jgi:hypothetical protein